VAEKISVVGALLFVLTTILFAVTLLYQNPVLDPPTYDAASIANSAASVANLYAPNTFLTIYGVNLAFVTRAIGPGDVSAGILPTSLTGTGLSVIVNGLLAAIYYVSPTQVNLLVPANLIAGPATIQLEVDGIAGPPIPITLGATAPGLFPMDAVNVLAAHYADMSLVTPAAPAQPGEEIVLYANGLGQTIPAAIPNQLPLTNAVLADMQDFVLTFNGVPVNPGNIRYAGTIAGYAGLFLIDFIVPAGTPANPQIQVGTSLLMSPLGPILPMQPQ
jgi:uncharacterized protein (TIGR03437 family)